MAIKTNIDVPYLIRINLNVQNFTLIQKNLWIFALGQYLLQIELKTEVMTSDHLSQVPGEMIFVVGKDHSRNYSWKINKG